MARVGIITGSGTYALPDFADPERHDLETPFGTTLLTEGRWADQTVLHVSRHGEGHARLSNHVNHRANVWALRELDADCVIACTACGALEPDQPLGGLIVFDELHFLANRLPDGSLCTLFTAPGDPARGHWIMHERAHSAVLPDPPPARGHEHVTTCHTVGVCWSPRDSPLPRQSPARVWRGRCRQARFAGRVQREAGGAGDACSEIALSAG